MVTFGRPFFGGRPSVENFRLKSSGSGFPGSTFFPGGSGGSSRFYRFRQFNRAATPVPVEPNNRMPLYMAYFCTFQFLRISIRDETDQGVFSLKFSSKLQQISQVTISIF